MASLLGFSTTSNYALYTIPGAWVLALIPHVYAVSTYDAKSSQKFDGRAPRDFLAQIRADQSIDARTKGQLCRAEATQANSFENLGPFAAAVVAASFAKIDPTWLNALAFIYLALRFVYNHLYMFGETKLLSTSRSLCYTASVSCYMAMFVMAGNKLRNAPL